MKLDLNALAVFDVVMTEQSLTRAAEKLALSQPAVSNTLARLRLRLKDPLFYKEGRHIKPTARALALWEEISPSLRNIVRATSPTTFDPGTARERFRVAADDFMVSLFWPPLRKVLEASAPGVDLLAHPYRLGSSEPMLEKGEVDFCIVAAETVSGRVRTAGMFELEYACVMRKGHPLSAGRLTVRRFAAADHLLVSLSGALAGPVDTALQTVGAHRRVAMTVNGFGSVLPLIAETDLIAVLPQRLVRSSRLQHCLHCTAPPVTLPPARVVLAWHPRSDRNPAHEWLRKTLLAIAARDWSS